MLKDRTINSGLIKSFSSKSMKNCLLLQKNLYWATGVGGRVREKSNLLMYWPLSPPKKRSFYDGNKAENFITFGIRFKMHQIFDKLRKFFPQVDKWKIRRVSNELEKNLLSEFLYELVIMLAFSLSSGYFLSARLGVPLLAFQILYFWLKSQLKYFQ